MVKPQPSEDYSMRYVVLFVSTCCLVGGTVALIQSLLPIAQVLLPVLVGLWVWRTFHDQRSQQQTALDTVFYQLLQEQQGQITVLDLAMDTRLPPIVVQQYLDTKAKEFAAQFEVTETGDMYYLFAVGRSRPSPAPLPVLQAPATHKFLTQAELARRLKISPSTLSRKKRSADLIEWTQARDPDGIGWAFLLQAQRFMAVK